MSSSDASPSATAPKTDDALLKPAYAYAENDRTTFISTANNSNNTHVRYISIDDAVDSIGIGKFQDRVLLAAGLCFAADAIEVTLLSFMSAILKAEWNLSTNEAASVTSSVFAGSLMGTFFIGPLGDRRGRKPAFLISAAIISIFGIWTAFTNNLFSFIVVRFIVGFGVGGITAPFDLLLETLPTAHRGRYLLLIELFWCAGSVTVPLIAWLTLGNGMAWNIFVLICAIPCVISAVLGMYIVPESPRWLLENNREAEAMCVLRDAAERNGKNAEELFPLDGTVMLKCNEQNDVGEGTETNTDGYMQLLSPMWRSLILRIWTVWFGFGFAYYGTILIITRIFQTDNIEGGGANDDANDNSQANFDYFAIFVSSSAEIVGLCFVLLTIDRWGRIPSQMLFYALGGVSVLVLCTVDPFVSTTLLTVLAFLARSFEMGASCVTWVSTPEMLGTEIRSTGHSSANAMARMGAFICPYIVEGDFHLRTVGMVLFVVHVFTVFAVCKLPETNGRSLGDMKLERQLSTVSYASGVSNPGLQLDDGPRIV